MEFYQTVMGHRFFEGQLPALIKALERIANALEPKELKTKYRCSKCHSKSVQHAHWVRVNTNEVLDIFGSWNEPDAAFCESCDGPCQIEECE